jgi:very-short-patch-repair endonuclease
MTNTDRQIHRDIFNRKLFEHARDLRDGGFLNETQCREALLNIQAKTFDVDGLEAFCESPIELMLGAALSWAINGYDQLRFLCPGTLYEFLEGESHQSKLNNTFATYFAPQVKIEMYRLDFLAASCCHGLVHYTAIECDGHDYHERTKGQASRDKKRDRALLGLGIPTLRFTGSDIHYKLNECVEEIEEFLFNRMEELLIKQGLVLPRKKAMAA